MTETNVYRSGVPLPNYASRRRLLIGALVSGACAAFPYATFAEFTNQSTPSVNVRVPLGEAVANLSPVTVWQRFYELTQIPRTSHNEAQVSAFVADFGRRLGLETDVDDVGNVLIRKPATAGLEDRQTVVLQAHMDMVGVAAEGSEHDFDTDPIEAWVDGDWVTAGETTLGADNGIGVAMIMAVLEASDFTHGPVEGLFTVNEEDGYTGASAVKAGQLRGTLLLNLDSEEEGVFTIGSSGGVNIEASMTYDEEPTPTNMIGVELLVAGLQGGHSGIDIDKGRGNAIKLLARLLNVLEDEFAIRISEMTGGDRYNAIPRNASALVAVPESDAATLKNRVFSFARTAGTELAIAEPELRIEAVLINTPEVVMETDAQHRVIDALNGCPNGVIRMSDSVPGLVETSSNLGTLSLGNGQMVVGILPRSAIDSARDAVAEMVASVFTLAGADTVFHDEYAGWSPNSDSPLLAMMLATYREIFGNEAGVMAVHAGLETSKFAETYPDMDMISLGPTLRDVHSPDERLNIPSVGATWELLKAALGRVPA